MKAHQVEKMQRHGCCAGESAPAAPARRQAGTPRLPPANRKTFHAAARRRVGMARALRLRPPAPRSTPYVTNKRGREPEARRGATRMRQAEKAHTRSRKRARYGRRQAYAAAPVSRPAAAGLFAEEDRNECRRVDAMRMTIQRDVRRYSTPAASTSRRPARTPNRTPEYA